MTQPVLVRMCDFQANFGYGKSWAYRRAEEGKFKIHVLGPRSSHVERAEVEAFLFGRPQQEGTE